VQATRLRRQGQEVRHDAQRDDRHHARRTGELIVKRNAGQRQERQPQFDFRSSQ